MGKVALGIMQYTFVTHRVTFGNGCLLVVFCLLATKIHRVVDGSRGGSLGFAHQLREARVDISNVTKVNLHRIIENLVT